MPFAQRLDLADRPLDLLPGRHQGRPVFQCPAVILHMGDLDPASSHVERHGHELFDAPDIGAVNDDVGGQRQFERNDLCREGALADIGSLIAGDAVGGRASLS